ncbi:hypothetical protein DFH06DRAFT_984888 [Mycena polygramma]|nr:hypothetical protein DFH06DRAFT_984888 [Mycena polygramma]
MAACNCACFCRDHCVCKVTQCEGDCAAHVSRNLVVSLDELSKDFGWQNTAVVELHNRILVDPNHHQLSYYDCATGTHTSKPIGPIRHLLRRVGNTVGRVTGWNFKKTILKAYLWLCEHYESGDKIFLFADSSPGFSRGAYQVRTLAAMIETVGLVHAGNFRLVPSFVLYLSGLVRSLIPLFSAQNFKTTFARNIKVHFVGAWDSVSYSGIGRKSGPIPSSEEHICFFRHALALDECRVKLLPVYTSPSQSVRATEKENLWDAASSIETKISAKSKVPNVKQVWFAGKHLCSVPLLWMENEATSAGLRLQSRKFGDEEEPRDTPKQDFGSFLSKKFSAYTFSATRYVAPAVVQTTSDISQDISYWAKTTDFPRATHPRLSNPHGQRISPSSCTQTWRHQLAELRWP